MFCVVDESQPATESAREVTAAKAVNGDIKEEPSSKTDEEMEEGKTHIHSLY